ncbi:MAG: hypothetical protein OHK0044_27870 [Burkholderiaceae bacterium]
MKANFELDPARWSRLRGLLDEALALAPAERATWVERLGAQDEDLKPRLRALLAHAAGSPLDTLPRVETSQFAPTPGDGAPAAGSAVGPYRLLRLLGEGGMGAVWLAERTDLLQRRRVALKLPRLVTGRAQLEERLAREREILAALEHPNIARLYDAGLAADGQPYLALEYVEGERIDAYCTRKALDLPARLRVFLQVARAVAHAHARLVVHRDLKPANLLVNDTGEVKLLDFGIAKLLEDGRAQETELTQLAGRALTPDYAAPEQILGEPIGTAVDVYALGVVLFELLTGQRPYRLKRGSRAALEEAIVQAEVRRPSSVVADARLKRRLRGDLDTIVLKALARTPAARYSSVEALAEDIERHLDRRPVRAQPDSAAYRLRKFVARNRLAASATAAVALAVLAGAGAAVWQARVAVVEQRRAEQVKDWIAEIFQDTDPASRSGGATPTSALELLAHARQRLDRDAALEPSIRGELLQVLGQSYWGLGEYKAAEQASRNALESGAHVWADDDPRRLRAELVLAGSLHPLGARDEARQVARELIARLEDPAGGDAVRQPAQYARAHLLLATFELSEGRQRSDLAFASARRAVAIFDGHRLDDRLGVFAHKVLGTVHRWRNEPAHAVGHLQRAYELALAAYGADGRHAQTLEVQNEYGRALARVGRLGEAIALMKLAVERAGALHGPKHVMVQHFAGTLGVLQLEYGEIKAALATLERAAAADLGEVVVSLTYQASRHAGMARAQLAAARPRAALAQYERALALLADATPRGAVHWQAEQEHALALALAGAPARAIALLAPLIDEHRRSRAAGYLQSALRYAGTAHRLQGDPAAARARFSEALELLAAITAKPNASAAHRLAHADALKEVGLVELDLGEPDAARERLHAALQRFRAIQVATTPAQADALVGLARAHLARRDAEQALAFASEADAFWRDFDADNRAAGEATFWLGQCYDALGRIADAKRAYARAATILARSPLPGDARLARFAGTRTPGARAGL